MARMVDSSLRTALPIVWRESATAEEYERARSGRVFNRRLPDRYPIAIVEAETEEHVVQAVHLAAQLKCRVSVRSGGHSWAVWSVRDEAVLIDLGHMEHVELDERDMVVSVSPSTTGSALNNYLAKRNVMFCGGHCPDVGLGGFLLQGGMGWNCRNWGWACEQVQAIDAVTAEGERIHIDAEQHSDLLWAAKGAGPGFPAIVTRFYLKVRPKIPAMLSSAFVYPIAKYREVLDWVIDVTRNYDDSTEIVAVSRHVEGKMSIIALFVTFQDSQEACRQALERANQTRPAGFTVEDVNSPTSLAKEYADQAGANPTGHRYCADNGYVSNEADVAAVLEPAFTSHPSEKTFALWYAMAPCSRRELPDMALSMQSDHYFAIYTIWEDQKDDERCQSWVRSVMKQIVPSCDGAYLGDSDFQVRQTKYWTDEKARKLMALRQKWDRHGRICGYLDYGDQTGVRGLLNQSDWCNGF